MERQQESDTLASQLAGAGAGLAYLLAAIGFYFLNFGLAIGFVLAGIFTLIASEKFEFIHKTKLQWPLVFSHWPVRTHWQTFRIIAGAGLIVAIVLSAIFATSFYVFDLRNQLHMAQQNNHERHLNDDQKERLRESLRLSPGENYYVDFNSLPNCDECEDFAEELREFVRTIPGWKTGGGTIMFADNGPRLVGLELAIREDEKDFPAPTKLKKAFDSASLPLASRYDNYTKGQIIIVIGRQPKS